ncbi:MULTISPECIES: SDR family NAD(P)-dependent oxidoreductase [unclassified Mycobacterium]|uniref:SDR family NAD(P)-dependent oxidoreductase n=1 Tax=unclassified Mycobacterium TaxID=2642494 RepID=UPI0007FFF588|nr:MULTISPECIES: SDR family NAD(P)-dependent oxidoreductase [unclassified Mycobacterium]OBB47424.1 short-chain dehydrogenase [Mycobacterium sp. 852002-51961_SCH5331710]OBG97382.1 short-chain dehydrogenase [Mycobacterium sp. E136]
MSRLENRNALVTGGAQGLGRAIARRLAAEGARVTIVDLNEDKANECVGLIESGGGTAAFVRANVAKREDIAAATAAAAVDGKLDVLVNAAQYFAMPKALELVTDKDWELSEATGPKATFRFMQTAFEALKASGRASVINFVSGSALGGMSYTAPYSAAKGAIQALTKVAANEWARHGIRVNALCPFALTDVQRDMIGTEWDNYTRTAAASPMKRGADPDSEIAPAVAFLASDDASFVTGTVLHVDGGMTELSTVDYSQSPGVFGAT